MSFFSSIGKVFSTVTKVADTVTNFIKSPVSAVTSLVQPLMDKLINKLPGGIGQAIQPFADKFLSAGINWLASGPLSGVMNFLSSTSGTASKIDGVIDQVNSFVQGGLNALPTAAQENVQNATAFTQAQGLLG